MPAAFHLASDSCTLRTRKPTWFTTVPAVPPVGAVPCPRVSRMTTPGNSTTSLAPRLITLPPKVTKNFLLTSGSFELRCQCPMVTPISLDGNATGCAPAAVAAIVKANANPAIIVFIAVSSLCDIRPGWEKFVATLPPRWEARKFQKSSFPGQAVSRKAASMVKAPAGGAYPMNEQDAVFAKCAWRLIPFMGLLYLANYIDRTNAGFAALTMNKDLSFSPTVFGFGAGVFFDGYLLFQVPANIVLGRVGARRWIFTILLIWGAISAATAFVQGPYGFYVLRFLLGIAEAGFFPGMIFYLTLWFPQAFRARFAAGFICAIPLSGVVGAPLSGLILGIDGFVGLHGWQWLFLIEGLPVSLLAFAVLNYLPDGPREAAWLTPAEKTAIATRLAGDAGAEDGDLWHALRDPRVVVLALAGFGEGSA